MGFFGKLIGGNKKKGTKLGVIDYGNNTIEGGHDHRYNKGDDRTPNQKKGDKKRRKS